MSTTEGKRTNWHYRIVAIVALMLTLGLSVSIAMAGLPTSMQGQGQTKVQAQQGALSNAPVAGPRVIAELKHDVSPPLGQIPPAAQQKMPSNEREQGHKPHIVPGSQDTDTVVQFFGGPQLDSDPHSQFRRYQLRDLGLRMLPPDTNGEVGPNHYVQIVNTAYEVFNKNGTVAAPAVPINTLWTTFGGACATHNDGDPVVNYDQLADRWVITQFTSSAPFTECFAVSTTGNPLGTYNRYAFPSPNPTNLFGDYPKIGVWPDGYYMSTNEFNAAGTTFLGAGNWAFDRTRMIAGLSATAVYFELPATDWGGQQPTDLDGTTLPAAGQPNLFVEIDDSAWDPTNIPTDQLQMWRFHVDFVTPANSTFTALPKFVPPTLAAFDGVMCNFGPCVPQPGTGQKLDTLSDRVMFRASYRHFPDGHEAVTFNHTVDSGY